MGLHCRQVTQEDALALAAAIEVGNDHPIAAAIVHHAQTLLAPETLFGGGAGTPKQKGGGSLPSSPVSGGKGSRQLDWVWTALEADVVHGEQVVVQAAAARILAQLHVHEYVECISAVASAVVPCGQRGVTWLSFCDSPALVGRHGRQRGGAAAGGGRAGAAACGRHAAAAAAARQPEPGQPASHPAAAAAAAQPAGRRGQHGDDAEGRSGGAALRGSCAPGAGGENFDTCCSSCWNLQKSSVEGPLLAEVVLEFEVRMWLVRGENVVDKSYRARWNHAP